MYPAAVALETPPRRVPAGANHGYATWSFSANVLSTMWLAGTTMLLPELSDVNPAG